MVLCPVATRGGGRVASHCVAETRPMAWSPAPSMHPALHRRPRWASAHQMLLTGALSVPAGWRHAIPSSDVTLFLQAISNKEQHSISYTLSRSHTVVVEYTHDGTSDMFQVPRPHVCPQESRQKLSLSGLTQFVKEQIYWECRESPVQKLRDQTYTIKWCRTLIGWLASSSSSSCLFPYRSAVLPRIPSTSWWLTWPPWTKRVLWFRAPSRALPAA